MGNVSALRSKAFALLYDPAFAAAERSGLRVNRKMLLSRASGRVVELGAGTGLNIEHYPLDISRLVLCEPDIHMIKALQSKATQSSLPIELSRTGATSIPAADHSVDTVVGTLVLCTVPDPAAALREIARVLTPGGQFLFLEHVRSEDLVTRKTQDLMRRPWSWLACGCQCNRDTLATLKASPLELQWSCAGRLRWLTPLLRPLVSGAAVAMVAQS